MLSDNKIPRRSIYGLSSPVSSPGVPPIYRDLHLLRELIRRDFNARFTGSALGLAWAVLQPLSLVVLYWFVFTFMIPGARGGSGDRYIYFLISGLIPWLAINEGIIRSTTSIVENSTMVRKLPFRSELLVIVPNATAIIFELISFAIFFVFLIARGANLRGLWLLPMAMMVQFALQLGIGLMLAATYVFFRDLTQVLGFVLSIIFYLSPILYTATGRFGPLLEWNPMTPLLGLFRSAALTAALPEASSIVYLVAVTFGAVTGGLMLFRRVQPTLVDLI
jgi:ABC-type polysaccharide/polyol phosphate export permease